MKKVKPDERTWLRSVVFGKLPNELFTDDDDGVRSNEDDDEVVESMDGVSGVCTLFVIPSVSCWLC